MLRPDQLGLDEAHLNKSALVGPKNWSFSYVLRAQTLKVQPTSPDVAYDDGGAGSSVSHSGSIYTVLAELFFQCAGSLAFWGWTPKLKMSQEKVCPYYGLRAERLDKLVEDWVRFDIDPQA